MSLSQAEGSFIEKSTADFSLIFSISVSSKSSQNHFSIFFTDCLYSFSASWYAISNSSWFTVSQESGATVHGQTQVQLAF